MASNSTRLNVEKQRLLLSSLVDDSNVFVRVAPIIQPTYFDPELRSLVRFVMEYHKEYGSLPQRSIITAETGVDLIDIATLTKAEAEYCVGEIAQFCRQQAIMGAVLESAGLIEEQEQKPELKIEGKIESLIKDAINVGVKREVGHSIFNDVEGLMEEIQEDVPWPLQYDALDEILGGGVRRQEMLVLSANSGGGKSLLMANFACNLAAQGLNVLFLSLELPVKMLKKRFVTMLTNISTKELFQNKTEVIAKMRGVAALSGEIFVDKCPVGTCGLDIRAYLNEFELQHGFIPDVLCLDYLDLMGSNDNISRENIFEKDKAASEEFREILVDYDMIGITASQQNRGAISDTSNGSKVPNMSHIAGGMSKVNTADVWLSIIMTDLMRAAGQIGIHAIKTRSSDGVGTTLWFKYNRVGLRMLNEETEPVDFVDMSSKSKGNKPSGDFNKVGGSKSSSDGKPSVGTPSRLLELFEGVDAQDG